MRALRSLVEERNSLVSLSHTRKPRTELRYFTPILRLSKMLSCGRW